MCRRLGANSDILSKDAKEMLPLIVMRHVLNIIRNPDILERMQNQMKISELQYSQVMRLKRSFYLTLDKRPFQRIYIGIPPKWKMSSQSMG